MRVNGSLLKSDTFSKKYKVLLFCTPTATLERKRDRDKLNSSSFYEAIIDKICTKLKIEE